MAPPLDLPREPLLSRLRERAAAGPPLVLAGPPGAGKSTLLRRLGRALEAEGWRTVSLDFLGAVSSPERFVSAALRALPADRFGAFLGRATELRRAVARRPDAAAAVESLFALWSSLEEAGGGPVALLIDEPTEIRSLSYFPGLRQAHALLAAALAARGRGTVLATSFPTLTRRLFPAFEHLEVGPLAAAELEPALRRQHVAADADALLRATFGWPRYLRLLWPRVAAGEPLAAAWAEEMAAGGALECACRHGYETLLLRSRGYGMSKALLAAVADEEGLNLTALVARLGRTPGAVRDYIGWLLGVDALRSARKRYFYVDGLLRWWVRLHGRGTPVEAAELRAAAERLMAAPSEEPVAAEAEAAVPAAPARHDQLMEID